MRKSLQIYFVLTLSQHSKDAISGILEKFNVFRSRSFLFYFYNVS